jgi:hypothetical protein
MRKTSHKVNLDFTCFPWRIPHSHDIFAYAHVWVSESMVFAVSSLSYTPKKLVSQCLGDPYALDHGRFHIVFTELN